jgi:hypothetical protein
MAADKKNLGDYFRKALANNATLGAAARDIAEALAPACDQLAQGIEHKIATALLNRRQQVSAAAQRAMAEAVADHLQELIADKVIRPQLPRLRRDGVALLKKINIALKQIDAQTFDLLTDEKVQTVVEHAPTPSRSAAPQPAPSSDDDATDNRPPTRVAPSSTRVIPAPMSSRTSSSSSGSKSSAGALRRRRTSMSSGSKWGSKYYRGVRLRRKRLKFSALRRLFLALKKS